MARGARLRRPRDLGRLALRPAMNPVVQSPRCVRLLAGQHVPGRVVFNWPGLGSYAADSMRRWTRRRSSASRCSSPSCTSLHLLVDIAQAGSTRGCGCDDRDAAAPLEVAVSRAPLRDFWRALRRQPLMAIGLGIIVAARAAGAAGPVDHALSSRRRHRHPPGRSARPRPVTDASVGTDQLGPRRAHPRDLRRAHSLSIVLERARARRLIGVPLGIIAGATRRLARRRDHADHRHLPGLPGAAALAGAGHVLTPSVSHAALAIAVTWWPWYARLARAARPRSPAAATSRRPRARRLAHADPVPPRAAQRAPADARAAVAGRRAGSCSPRPRSRSSGSARRTRRRSGA